MLVCTTRLKRTYKSRHLQEWRGKFLNYLQWADIIKYNWCPGFVTAEHGVGRLQRIPSVLYRVSIASGVLNILRFSRAVCNVSWHFSSFELMTDEDVRNEGLRHVFAYLPNRTVSIFEVLKAMQTEAQVFKQGPPCRLVNIYRRFGGCCVYICRVILPGCSHSSTLSRRATHFMWKWITGMTKPEIQYSNK
jgi:hypothetical protein